MPPFPAARRVIAEAIAARVCPAAVVEVGTDESVRWREAFGAFTYAAGAPPAADDTVFDLASLTKVLATTMLAMAGAREGLLSLEDPVERWLPDWRGADRSAVTIRHLLLHASGLPGWKPLSRTCRGRAEFLSAICAMPLESKPGDASVYSDLGFILLGFVLERALGRPLDEAFERLRGTLDVAPIRFNPPAAWRSRIAPTGVDASRGGLLQGQVHDDNAAALGGVAGHAGLFAPAAAVGRLARLWLAGAQGQACNGLFDSQTLVQGFTRRGTVPGSSRALGWDTMLPTSSCGTRMSPRAFGHTGFTGTSLWIDPDPGLYVVLLTNRVYPKPAGEEIKSLRRDLHDAIFTEIGR